MIPLDVNDAPATDKDMAQIRKSRCVPCNEPYSDDRRTVFVITQYPRTHLVWWHAKHPVVSRKKH